MKNIPDGIQIQSKNLESLIRPAILLNMAKLVKKFIPNPDSLIFAKIKIKNVKGHDFKAF